MSLLRALQREGILSDLSARTPAQGVVVLASQSLTSNVSSASSDNDASHISNVSAISSSLRPTLSTVFRRDNLTVGTRVVIAQDADLRGEISVGSGTVIHPKATILALQGPIFIGSNCIIEETAVIVNRRSTPINIGDNNLFEVGCRIEAASVGSHNVFEVRSRVAQNVKIGSYSVVGAGCTLLPKPITHQQLLGIFDDVQGSHAKEATIQDQSQQEGAEDGSESIDESGKQDEEVFEELPNQTVVFGADNRRRIWSGEGAQQQAALHTKHLEYLRDTISHTHKLKIIQGSRAVAPVTASIS